MCKRFLNTPCFHGFHVHSALYNQEGGTCYTSCTLHTAILSSCQGSWWSLIKLQGITRAKQETGIHSEEGRENPGKFQDKCSRKMHEINPTSWLETEEHTWNSRKRG